MTPTMKTTATRRTGPRHRLAGAALSIAVLAVPLASCSGAAKADTAAAKPSRLTIGLSLPAATDVFWGQWANTAQSTGEALGVDIKILDSHSDYAQQVTDVKTLVSEGVDGLVVAPVPGDSTPIVAAANAAKIPLISSNRVLDADFGGVQGANPRVFTGFDDEQIGSLQGDLVVDACQGKSPCHVVLEEGEAGASSQILRTQGLEKALAGKSDIQIVDRANNDFLADKATAITGPLLERNPDADVLLTQGDPEAVAAQAVVAQQGRAEQIRVIGIGGSIDGIRAVQDGRLFGTVRVSAGDDAATSVRTLVSILRGEDVKLLPSAARPTVQVAAVKVDAANADTNLGDW